MAQVFVKPRVAGEKVPLEPGANEAGGRRHLKPEGEMRPDCPWWHRMVFDGSAVMVADGSVTTISTDVKESKAPSRAAKAGDQ